MQKGSQMEITDRSKCCGCSACYSICPVKCINMVIDPEGFLYPAVDEEKCINCGLCKKVCPINHAFEKTSGLAVYAAISKESKVLSNCASGGVFFHLARQTLNENGVVFGARYNEDFSIVHDFTENIDAIPQYMGSKYVQSKIGENYKIAKEFLDSGRKVLFTGVPCQILGLRNYLQKDYDNLIAVNLICHSCPSPKVFKVFIEDICKKAKLPLIKHVTMRYKQYNVTGQAESNYMALFDQLPKLDTKVEPVYKKVFYETSFGRGFGRGLFARPSCFVCPAKNLTSGSDITIGDFWGIEKFYPNLNSKSGVSVVITQTNNGARYFEAIKSQFMVYNSTFEQVIEKNPRLITPLVADNNLREKFWQDFINNPTSLTIKTHTKPTLKSKIRNLISFALRKLKLRK